WGAGGVGGRGGGGGGGGVVVGGGGTGLWVESMAPSGPEGPGESRPPLSPSTTTLVAGAVRMIWSSVSSPYSTLSGCGGSPRSRLTTAGCSHATAESASARPSAKKSVKSSRSADLSCVRIVSSSSTMRSLGFISPSVGHLAQAAEQGLHARHGLGDGGERVALELAVVDLLERTLAQGRERGDRALEVVDDGRRQSVEGLELARAGAALRHLDGDDQAGGVLADGLHQPLVVARVGRADRLADDQRTDRLVVPAQRHDRRPFGEHARIGQPAPGRGRS